MNWREKTIGGITVGFLLGGVVFAFLVSRNRLDPNAGMARVALVFLSVIITGLIGAALYGVFGRPASRRGKNARQHVVNGFRLAGGILLGIVLIGTLIACSQIAFGIVTSTRLSRGVAVLISLGALALVLWTIKHWAKYFVGWIGYSVWNGLLMVGTGHAVNSVSVQVPRWLSISGTAIMFISALVSVRFAEHHKLLWSDKAALSVWLSAFVLAVDVESSHLVYREPIGLAAMSVGCLALVVAWWYQRGLHHHHHHINQKLPQEVAG